MDFLANRKLSCLDERREFLAFPVFLYLLTQNYQIPRARRADTTLRQSYILPDCSWSLCASIKAKRVVSEWSNYHRFVRTIWAAWVAEGLRTLVELAFKVSKSSFRGLKVFRESAEVV